MRLRLPLKSFLLLAAGLTVAVLAFAVLIGHPRNEIDYLAWSAIITGAALVILIYPER